MRWVLVPETPPGDTAGPGPVSESVPEEGPHVLADGFEDYVRGSIRRLFGRAYWRCDRQWHLAEDIVQETYLRLWRAWPERRDSITQHERYSGRVLDNVFFDYYRRKQPEVRDGIAPEAPAVPGNADGQEAPHDDIRRAVAELPQQQRELMYLHYYGRVAWGNLAPRLPQIPA